VFPWRSDIRKRISRKKKGKGESEKRWNHLPDGGNWPDTATSTRGKKWRHFGEREMGKQRPTCPVKS